MPSVDRIPVVGRSEYNEALIAGVVMDPSVSTPTAIGINPALIATAEPEEDPKADLGLLVYAHQTK